MPIKGTIMVGKNTAAHQVSNATEPSRIPIYLKGAEVILADVAIAENPPDKNASIANIP